MTYENPNSAGQGGMQSETSPADMRAAQAATPATAEPVESLDKGNEMARGLNNRHVQFIAIGGTIGTGLFLGSGKSIALTGPSIIFVYIGVGLIMFLLMRAIGEMMYRDPSQHTFINFITRYLGRGWGKFAGWTYWIVLILTGMTEITAVSTYFVTFFGMFDINLKAWKWLIELCFLVALTCVNLIAVKVFGEAEFWFSMIKITLIVGLIATAVVMVWNFLTRKWLLDDTHTNAMNRLRKADNRLTPEELEAKWQNSFSHRLGVWSLEHTPNGWPK